MNIPELPFFKISQLNNFGCTFDRFTGQVDGVNFACIDGKEKLSNQIEYLNLEEEVHRVLQELKNSQEHEFRITQDRLHARKNHISSLYQQLVKEKSELERLTPLTDHDALLKSIATIEERIKSELCKLRDMEKVAIGCGKTP